MTTARLWQQQQLGYVPHTSVDGETWQLVAPATTTSAGASDGTTVVATQFSGNNADDFNGRYWIEILSGSCKGEWCRIVDDNGSGTFTLEDTGFSAQIGSAVQFNVWLSPEPVIVLDGAASATAFNDDYRDEDDDFWKDYYAVPITGNLRGEIQQITAFDKTGGASEGLFTTDSFSQAPAAGDVMLLRRFVEVSPPSPGLTEPYIARPGQRVNFSRGDGTRGPRGGTFAFNTQVYGSGALAASGSSPGKSPIAGLLQGCGYTEFVGTTMDVGAGSTTTVIKVDATQHERVGIGEAVMWNGQIAWVTDKQDQGASPDDITVSPAFNAAPAENDLLYALRTYKKSTSGDELGVVLEWEVDGVRHTVTGCKGNVSFQEQNPIQAAWSFSVDHFVEQYAPAPYNAAAAYTTLEPVLDQDRMAWIDTTRTSIEGLTWSLNATVQARMVQGDKGINGRSGYQFTDLAPGGTFRELLESADTDLPQLQRWYQRDEFALTVQLGSHANALGLRVKSARLIERSGVQDANGLVAAPNVFQAQDAGTVAWDSDDDAVDDTITTVGDLCIALS